MTMFTDLIVDELISDTHPGGRDRDEYTCCMCKEKFTGEPRCKNAAGNYCDECFEEWRNRMAIGVRNSYAQAKEEDEVVISGKEETCNWCGKPVAADPARKKKPIHKKCLENRHWLLKCIRHSDHVFRYVELREKEEKPIREQRKAARMKARLNGKVTGNGKCNGHHNGNGTASHHEGITPVVQTAPAVNPETDKRIDRMEKMLFHLMTELGVTVQE